MSKTQDAFHNWLTEQGPLDSVQFWHCWKAASELSAQRIAELEAEVSANLQERVRMQAVINAFENGDRVSKYAPDTPEIASLRQQRDELLAALEKVESADLGDYDRETIEAAIAKVKP